MNISESSSNSKNIILTHVMSHGLKQTLTYFQICTALLLYENKYLIINIKHQRHSLNRVCKWLTYECWQYLKMLGFVHEYLYWNKSVHCVIEYWQLIGSRAGRNFERQFFIYLRCYLRCFSNASISCAFMHMIFADTYGWRYRYCLSRLICVNWLGRLFTRVHLCKKRSFFG